jgi:DNA replication protein DnaC
MFGHTVQYHRVGRLLSELQLMKGDGQYGKRLQELSKMDVLILDDFGLSPLSEAQQWDLLEILDDRHNKCSTVVTSQIPVKLWHDTLNDKTLADAILDRLIHNAHRLEMKGESMRKKQSTLATENEQTQNKK